MGDVIQMDYRPAVIAVSFGLHRSNAAHSYRFLQVSLMLCWIAKTSMKLKWVCFTGLASGALGKPPCSLLAGISTQGLFYPN